MMLNTEQTRRNNLIIQSVDANYVKFLELSYSVHARYAAICDADYEVFTGLKDTSIHPSWNRIAMFLEAFEKGYKKIVWIDADSLVVNLDASIFEATDDDVPLQMSRYEDRDWGGVRHPNGGLNAGVLVINNSSVARRLLMYIWQNRHASFEHHVTTFWEQNWLIDWCIKNPDDVIVLDQRFNWIPLYAKTPEKEVIIKSWHGYGDQMFSSFEAEYNKVYRGN